MAKSALAKVNPVLIADPTDNGKSALIAAGLSRESGGFKSVQAKTVFSRCARAFPPLSSREANTIALNRNEYLHSAAPSFAALPKRFGGKGSGFKLLFCSVLEDRTLEEFVGSERMQDIEAQLEADRENRKRRVEALIGRARQRLELRSHSDVSARLVSEFGQVPALLGTSITRSTSNALFVETRELCWVRSANGVKFVTTRRRVMSGKTYL